MNLKHNIIQSKLPREMKNRKKKKKNRVKIWKHVEKTSSDPKIL